MYTKYVFSKYFSSTANCLTNSCSDYFVHTQKFSRVQFHIMSFNISQTNQRNKINKYQELIVLLHYTMQDEVIYFLSLVQIILFTDA